jgi:hypothetical protein
VGWAGPGEVQTMFGARTRIEEAAGANRHVCQGEYAVIAGSGQVLVRPMFRLAMSAYSQVLPSGRPVTESPPRRAPRVATIASSIPSSRSGRAYCRRQVQIARAGEAAVDVLFPSLTRLWMARPRRGAPAGMPSRCRSRSGRSPSGSRSTCPGWPCRRCAQRRRRSTVSVTKTWTSALFRAR